METEIDVKTVKVVLMCPDCEIEMGMTKWLMNGAKRKRVGNGQFILKGSKTYVYKCYECEHIQESEILYPYIKYVFKDSTITTKDYSS